MIEKQPVRDGKAVIKYAGWALGAERHKNRTTVKYAMLSLQLVSFRVGNLVEETLDSFLSALPDQLVSFRVFLRLLQPANS